MPNTFYIMPTTPGKKFGVLGLKLWELMEFLWCVVTGGPNLSKMSPKWPNCAKCIYSLLWHWKHYWSILVTIKPFSMIQNIIFSHIHLIWPYWDIVMWWDTTGSLTTTFSRSGGRGSACLALRLPIRITVLRHWPTNTMQCTNVTKYNEEIYKCNSMGCYLHRKQINKIYMYLYYVIFSFIYIMYTI